MTNTQDIFTQIQTEIGKLASFKPEELNMLPDKIQDGLKNGFNSVIDEVKKASTGIKAPEAVKDAKWFHHFLSDKEKNIADQKEARRIGFNRYVHAILKPEGSPFSEKLTEFKHALQTEGSAAAGGYTVPTDTMKLIADDIRDNGITLGKVSIIPVGTNLIKLPTLSSILTPQYTQEGAPKPVVNYTFGVTTFTIKKYSFIVPFTDELLEDSSSDLEGYLRQNIGEYYGALLDNILFRGDANITGLYGMQTAFQLTQGKSFDTITTDDLINAIGLLRTVDLKGAEWYMSPSVWAHLHTKKDDMDRYLLSEYDIKNRTLLGIPVTLTDSAYSMNESAPDMPFITLGNLKKVYMAMRAGMTMARSTEASFADGNVQRSAFQDNLTLFRTEMRFDIQAPFASRLVQIKTTQV